MMLGWLLYFKVALKTGSSTFSKLGLKFLYSRIFKFFATFEKKLCSSSAVLNSMLIKSQLLLRSIASLFIDLSDKSFRFSSLPKYFVICSAFLIQIFIVIYFSFSQKRNTFISLLGI